MSMVEMVMEDAVRFLNQFGNGPKRIVYEFSPKDWPMVRAELGDMMRFNTVASPDPDADITLHTYLGEAVFRLYRGAP